MAFELTAEERGGLAAAGVAGLLRTDQDERLVGAWTGGETLRDRGWRGKRRLSIGFSGVVRSCN